MKSTNVHAEQEGESTLLIEANHDTALTLEVPARSLPEVPTAIPSTLSRTTVHLSAVIPALNEAENLRELLPRLAQTLSNLARSFEIIVVCGPSNDGTEDVARAQGARVIRQAELGYGRALEEGFRAARGSYILTLDGDQSHDPAFIEALWQARQHADMVIGSRYVEDGGSDADRFRGGLSRVLNTALRCALDINLMDLSSGFRLYRSGVVNEMTILRHDFSALVEIAVKAYADGWNVTEVPFHYRERRNGQSHAQVVRFGLGFVQSAYRMWRLRNSIACADYDARAYKSRIAFQRYWQRSRCEIINRLASGQGRILDIGCGTSHALEMLKGSVTGLDIQVNKLRYARGYGVPRTQADAFHLPYTSESFDCVVCSQLIEHLPAGLEPFDEMMRVLKPGGRLVLGTPDYGTVTWPAIERVYGVVARGAYADEHITQYTKAGLIELLESYGITIQSIEYVFGSELIISGTKDGAPAYPTNLLGEQLPFPRTVRRDLSHKFALKRTWVAIVKAYLKLRQSAAQQGAA
ncbi:glycosyltransferase [Chloroflexota bacterium]